MAFRADESVRSGFESVKSYLIPRNIEAGERERSEKKLFDIVEKFGPVVEAYPSWHPLVDSRGHRCSTRTPSDSSGYEGLDHKRFFANAFITCPYGDGQKTLDSVKARPYIFPAIITAERLDVQLYSPDATPILVRCDWEEPISSNGMIPASIAIPLILQKELACWEGAERGESWEAMRSEFLGSPHGSRSSLFVNQETGSTMKKVWNLLMGTGAFGPIKGSNQN